MFVGLTVAEHARAGPEIAKPYNNKSPDPGVGGARRRLSRQKGDWLEIFKTSAVPTYCPKHERRGFHGN